MADIDPVNTWKSKAAPALRKHVEGFTDPQAMRRDGDLNTLVAGGQQGADFSAYKLLWHGERTQHLLRGEDIAPVQIELSLTMACNETCKWCVDLPWRSAFFGSWDPDLLLERLQEFYDMGTRSITIEGGGEPTVYRQFERIVIEAQRMGFNLGLITNGVLMKRYAYLVPLFKWIRVSLDAYSEETHKELKGIRAFEVVMSGLEALAAERAVTGARTTLGVGYLGSMDTVEIEKLKLLVARLRSIGLDYVQFRRITEHPELDAGHVDLDPLLEYDTTLYPTERERPFRVYIHQLNEVTTGNAGLPCLAHALVAVVGGAGDIWLCQRLRSPQNGLMGQIGDLTKQTVAEVWQGEARREWMQRVLDPAWTQAHCPECRLTKFNIPLNRQREIAATGDFL